MISIIIPFHNCSQYIGRCILSVIQQKYNDYEIVLINDASTDDSLEVVLEVLKKYPEIKFTLLSLEENKGPSFARNRGIENAKGEYIYFIDADDELSSANSLETFAKHIGGGYDFITAETQYKFEDIDGRGKILKNSDLNDKLPHDTAFTQKEVFEAFLERKISVVVWNKLYRKTFLQENKIFFQEGILHEDDIWTFTACYYAKSTLAINAVTYHYNQSNAHSIMNNFSQKNIDSIQFALEYIVDFCGENRIFDYYNEQKVVNWINGFCRSLLHRKNTLKHKKQWLKIYTDFQKVYQNNKVLKRNSLYFSRKSRRAYFWEKYYKKYSAIIDFVYSIKNKLTSIISQ